MKKALFVFLTFLSYPVLGQKNVRAAFYKAISSSNLADIDKSIAIFKRSAMPENEACLGTLLMKKAELVTSKKEKLSLFKEGHAKLEHAIEKDTTKTEFRFFRLMIEEHAPKFLGYHHDIEKDCLYIKNHYEGLSATIKQFIIDYSQTSKALVGLHTP